MRELSLLRICVEKKFMKQTMRLNQIKNSKVKAAFMKKFMWQPGSEIKIYFMKNNPNIERTSLLDIKNPDPLASQIKDKPIVESIKDIITERYAKFLGLKFSFTDDINDSTIRIDFDANDGCWSYVGTECKDFPKQVTMNFGWFDVNTVLHEFGHALGMIHEHQNPNDNQIKWDLDAVYTWAKQTQGWDKETTYENIIEETSIDQINGSAYDPASIMLYFFPASLTLNNIGTQENARLSARDVIHLAKMYPGGEMTPDDFYNYAYKMDIETAAKKQMLTESDKGISYIIFVIIGVVIILGILLFFALKK